MCKWCLLCVSDWLFASGMGKAKLYPETHKVSTDKLQQISLKCYEMILDSFILFHVIVLICGVFLYSGVRVGGQMHTCGGASTGGCGGIQAVQWYNKLTETTAQRQTPQQDTHI